MTLEKIKELISLVEESGISGLEITEKDSTIKIEKQLAAAPAAYAVPQAMAVPAAAPAAPAEAAAVGGEVITSPMVGTFYKSPSPDSPAFVKLGDTVSKGQTICILEAMKIFNEVEAEFDCKILEFLVQDGQVVEYDTPLFRVEKL